MSKYSDISLDWCSEILADIGYGIQARRILEPLFEGGADIKLIPNEHYIPEERKIKDPLWIDRISSTINKKDTGIRINFCVPGLYKHPPEGTNIGFTMWETTQYPREWVNIINKMSGFWVGSKALKKSALDSNITVPVDVVTACLDIDEWTPDGDKIEFAGINEDDIVFMYVGSWIPRKNFVDLITAFACEFDGQRDVALVLKTWGGDNSQGFRDQVKGALQNHLNNLHGVSRPKISLIMDILGEDQILKMMRRADVYTSPSHGEGFDLPLVQAMACGCLPVVNDFLAHGDYVTEENAILYDYSIKPVYGAGVPLYHAYQRWSTPNVDSYMKALRRAYQVCREEREVKDRLLKNARDTIKNYYDPQKNADHIANLIRQIRNDMEKGSTPKELVRVPVS